MKIEQPGHYRTQHGLRAEVTSIRNTKAIGWVEDGTSVHPSAWEIEEGKIWNGRWGDDLVAEWQPNRLTSTKPVIPAPGLYRDQSGRKIEVLAIRDGLAIGYLPNTCPPSHGCWDAVTGRDTTNPIRGSNLVADWREPVSKTTTIVLCETAAGDHYVNFFMPEVKYRKIVARKTVTITEGEGMP